MIRARFVRAMEKRLETLNDVAIAMSKSPHMGRNDLSRARACLHDPGNEEAHEHVTHRLPWFLLGECMKLLFFVLSIDMVGCWLGHLRPQQSKNFVFL